jgi:hypothetical protein
MRSRKISALFVFNLLLICLTTVMTMAQGNGNGNKPIKQIIHLQPGTTAPMATGIAKITLKSNGNAIQRFQVVGANLTKGMSYTLVVDGNVIATSAADTDEDTSAAVEFIFSKKTKGGSVKNNNLPAVLDPVTKIKHVELRDANNGVVLSGDFSQP